MFFSNNNARSYDFADIDGDGDIDIVNSESNGGNIVIWLNDGSENFTVGATVDPPGSGVEGPMWFMLPISRVMVGWISLQSTQQRRSS